MLLLLSYAHIFSAAPASQDYLQYGYEILDNGSQPAARRCYKCSLRTFLQRMTLYAHNERTIVA
jgi:hypothetical protein